MYIYNALVTFTDCNIYSNTAQSGLGYPQHGGAFYIVGGTTQVTFTDCNIYQNTAYGGGGGVLINGGIRPTVTFSNCNIYQNSDLPVGRSTRLPYGGGVAMWGGTVTFTDCNIHNNQATNGGGVSINEGTATFTNCDISSNTANSATNMFVASVSTVCTFAMSLTSVSGSVSTCPAPPPTSPPPCPPPSPPTVWSGGPYSSPTETPAQ